MRSGGVCVAEVRGGGLRCWGLCVFVIKCVCRLWVFSVVVGLDSGTQCHIYRPLPEHLPLVLVRL